MKAPTRIAVDLTPLLPGGANGGAKVFVLELLKELAAAQPACDFMLLVRRSAYAELAPLEKANMRRTVVLEDPPAPPSASLTARAAAKMRSVLPPRVAAALLRRAGGLRDTFRVRRRHPNHGADLLYCPFTAPTLHRPGVPTVCTLYDLQYKSYPGFFTPDELANRDAAFLSATHRASALAAISEFTKKEAIKYAKVDPARIAVIPLRIAHRVLSVDPALACALLARLGLESDRYLLYPANFWAHKNHEMLLTAFGMARAQGLDQTITLVFTGSRDARQEAIKSAARALGLAERVVFTGYLDDPEFAAVMANCRGVIYPSLFEGFGIPIVEAMAARKPVACSSVTSLPEIAGDAALLFDPRLPADIADAMRRLVDDRGLRERLVAAGSARLHEYQDPARMAREYWNLFLSALANERHETLLQGVYADGWAGASMQFFCAERAGAALEATFEMPDWHPVASVTARWRTPAGRDQSVQMRRGEQRVLRIDCSRIEDSLTLDFSPVFKPSANGGSADARELSVLVRRARLIQPDGSAKDLLEEATA